MFLQRTGSSLLYTEGSQLYLEQESFTGGGLSGVGGVCGPEIKAESNWPHISVCVCVCVNKYFGCDAGHCQAHAPGDAMAVAGLRPAASTMLPSVWTTISVAFWVLRPSPSCRVVLPL